MPSKTLRGTVSSTKMDKTAVVVIEVPKKHAKYGKRYIKFKKYKVHDEANVLNEGDVVSITESRPLSKTKRWALKEVLVSSKVEK